MDISDSANAEVNIKSEFEAVFIEEGFTENQNGSSCVKTEKDESPPSNILPMRNPFEKVSSLGYSKDDLAAAIAEIKSGKSYRFVSNKYGIPRSTLNDKIRFKYSEGKDYTGTSSALGAEQEDRLLTWITKMSDIGYGRIKRDICLVVKSILDEGERASGDINEADRLFRDNFPSQGWTYRFLQRRPDLRNRIPEYVAFQRVMGVRENDIRNWFTSFEAYLQRELPYVSVNELLSEDNGHRVFSVGHTSLPLTKEQVTVLCCVSASGVFCQPLLIFPTDISRFNVDVVSEEYKVINSMNGFVSPDIFFDWLSNSFYPFVKESLTSDEPILLFMDGYSPYISLATSEFCTQKHIILYCFIPQTAIIMQPMVTSVLHPLKEHWNECFREFSASHPYTKLERKSFLPWFDKAWKKVVQKPENVKSDFWSSGLVPFNVENLDFSKLPSSEKGPNLPKSVTSVKRTELTSILGERVGVSRCVSVLHRILPKELKTLYKSRLEDGYEVEEDTESNYLWQIYKEIYTMYQNFNSIENNLNSSTDRGHRSNEGTSDNIFYTSSIPEDDLIPSTSAVNGTSSTHTDMNETSLCQDEQCTNSSQHEDQGSKNMWIKCSMCIRRFHKDCIGKGVGSVADSADGSLVFRCTFCCSKNEATRKRNIQSTSPKSKSQKI